MNRRHFLSAALSTGAAPLLQAQASGGGRPERLVGVQIAPHSLLHEGIEPCLDFLQEHAGINALFLYSQTYHMSATPLKVLATDHPKPPRDPQGRTLPGLWMRYPATAFAGLAVQHEKEDAARDFSSHDVFAELSGPCQKRGIKVYARILEAGSNRADRIPGYDKVAAVDLDGKPSHGPCWNHPDYREWVRMTVEQSMKQYPLDGFQYGAERVGPLSEVLFRGSKPACFCDHCIRRNRAAGIDPDRARTGYRRLYELIHSLGSGSPKPADGVLTVVLRELLHYPEVMAWYNEWFKADSEIQTMVYRTAKAVRPTADVGQHVDHQRSSWDIFYRAAVSYGQMAEENDFIKPIVYHDILGPRLKEWVIDRMQPRVLGDFSHEQALNLFYALFGHSPEREPAFKDLMTRGFSPEYVHREIKRCVDGAAGKARVYAGIGFNVPAHTATGMEKFPGDPELVTLAVRRAIDAGASGVVASREYDEMSLPNLRAFKAGL